MICMYINTFHVSVISPNATLVIYGILFGGIHTLVTLLININTVRHPILNKSTRPMLIKKIKEALIFVYKNCFNFIIKLNNMY